MVDGREIESTLQSEIGSRLERLSETRHRPARDHRILTEAATQLRLGRSAALVLAAMREQSPTLLRDYADVQVTALAARPRSPGRLPAGRLVVAVAAAPRAARVRVWQITSGGRGPRTRRPRPEGVDVGYSRERDHLCLRRRSTPPRLSQTLP
jgi:hypothetical protein